MATCGQFTTFGDYSVDLFNHGAHDGAWYGEDYAFSRNWLALGGDIWIVPDLNLTHHSPTEIATVTASLVRARSPSDRRLTIFV